MNEREIKHLDSVKLSKQGNSVTIIDQTLLPNETVRLDLKEAGELYEAIHQLRVRGAPAIGIFAGYALYCLALQIDAGDYAAFMEELKSQADYLNSSRPTAVNLSWALNRMVAKAEAAEGKTKADVLQDLKEECIAIHDEDIAMCKAISEYGLTLIKDGDGILTHCNAGPLATSRYGTALGPIMLGYERGMDFRVFADETRPLLQGARLTSYELEVAGIDVTLICDNMASIVMSKGWVQACFVGCDRVAANGDAANKIGTSGVAILAKYYDIPFYVLGPTSTIDLNTATGADIEIELRDPNEIRKKWYEKPMALPETRCFNPAFDVTPHELIDAIVTDKGICRAPYTESLKALFE
ncbi:MAG TPA: S-methyl-5-thioribose-1-phosphate isomerase [Clostridiaceae bacterium]|jgi:methylthioribose-1-phosphate isomerase|nr:S-methyl-5-thioribose-1-phosphate isomerase [Clostridiaceae bacterium]